MLKSLVESASGVKEGQYLDAPILEFIDKPVIRDDQFAQERPRILVFRNYAAGFRESF